MHIRLEHAEQLEDLITRADLHYRAERCGGLVIPFEAERAAEIAISASVGDTGFVEFRASLPRVTQQDEALARHCLLRNTFSVQFIGVSQGGDGRLCLRATLPLAAMSPPRIAAVIRSMAAAADVESSDLIDPTALQDTNTVVTQICSQLIGLNSRESLRDVACLAIDDNFHITAERQGLHLRLSDGLLALVTTSRRAISLLVTAGPAPSRDHQAIVHLLDVNACSDFARVAIDGDGAVAILVEAPSVYPSLLSDADDAIRRIAQACSPAVSGPWRRD